MGEMMADDSNINIWETESIFNGSVSKNYPSLQRRIFDHRVRSDGIGENITCHHTQPRSCKSGPDIRHINSVIYTKPVDMEEYIALQSQAECNHQHKGDFNGQTIGTNHGDCNPSTMNTPSSICSITKDTRKSDHADDEVTGQSTYRCSSTFFPDTTLFLEPPTSRSTISSEGTERTARVERRCKIKSNFENIPQKETIKRERYTVDDRQIVQISTTSLSSLSLINCQESNESDIGKKTAYTEWIHRKQEASQRKKEEEKRAAKKRQEEEEKIMRKKEEKIQLEKENFLKWIKTKRQQELDRKAMLKNELELQNRLKEIEDKAAVANALYLRHWVHKKKEEEKVRHKEQEMRQKKMDEEREKRLEQSSKAYEKWKENSKTKPKPATQGLLPHQKAQPAYINPIPWQTILDIDSDEKQANAFNDKKKKCK